jgi:hypothetical protein
VNSWATPRDDLLEAPPEDEGVAALETHHGLAGPRAFDQQRVDRLLAGRSPARELRRVDDLDVRPQLRQQLARRQPVGDDDVGLLQGASARHRDQLGVTGSAADQHDARGLDPVLRRGDLPTAQAHEDLVAHGRGPLRVPAAQNRHRQRSVPSGRRRPGSGGLRVVAADAEDPARLRLRGDLLVDLATVGGDDHVPGAVDVAATVLPLVPHQLTGQRVTLDGGCRHR